MPPHRHAGRDLLTLERMTFVLQLVADAADDDGAVDATKLAIIGSASRPFPDVEALGRDVPCVSNHNLAKVYLPALQLVGAITGFRTFLRGDKVFIKCRVVSESIDPATHQRLIGRRSWPARLGELSKALRQAIERKG